MGYLPRNAYIFVTGNSTSAILEGGARVHLLNWRETYFTTAPYAHCKGIVIGTLSMELGGKVIHLLIYLLRTLRHSRWE